MSQRFLVASKSELLHHLLARPERAFLRLVLGTYARK